MDDNMKRKQRIVSLTLAATMLLSGCRHDRFELVENGNNELIASSGSYIGSKYLYNYYVVELYNKVTGENEIHILRKDSYNGYSTKDTIIYYYYDIFTNLKVTIGDEESIFEYVKETCLSEYIIALNMGQLEYSYDEMKELYEAIKEIYVFENNSSLRKVLTNKI